MQVHTQTPQSRANSNSGYVNDSSNNKTTPYKSATEHSSSSSDLGGGSDFEVGRRPQGSPSKDFQPDRSQPSTSSAYGVDDSGRNEPGAPESDKPMPYSGSQGSGRSGISSSLMDSRIDGGTGYNDHGWDYGPKSADDGTSTAKWYSDETYGSASGVVGAQAESYSEDGSYGVAVNAGVGAKASAGYSDAEGNHVVGYGSGSVSGGARLSTDYNEETGYRSSTAGVGAGATGHVGVSVGDGDSSSSVGVAASADMAVEASVVTAGNGAPIGVAGNVGGDLGVEGELSHHKTTDVGTAGSTITGGADIGVGAGGEFGMRSDGTFAVAAEVDLGPIGGGISMEIDTNKVEDRGNAIDDYWNSGRKTEAFTQTADLSLDLAETVPGLGNAVGALRDVGYGVEGAYHEFADGDVLGGLEALGDGWLDGMENLPFAGDALANARDWVTDGGLKDAAHEVADFSVDLVNKGGEFISDTSTEALGVAKDIVSKMDDVGDDIGDGIKDAGNAIADGAKDAGNAIADGAKAAGNAVADALGF